MATPVYFYRFRSTEESITYPKGLTSLFHHALLKDCIKTDDLVAIKCHFGEKGNDTYIPPVFVKHLVDEIKQLGGKPFLTDTCVLYRSQRDNSVDHLNLANEHGFSLSEIGAPVIIGDGLLGDAEKLVSITGDIFQEVSVAAVALETDAIIVLSHVTGHMASGMGAAIKNIGMGFASKKGKLRQHSMMKPTVSSKRCTGCQLCIEWCPTQAIYMNGEVALIDTKQCIGCGECFTMCRYGAIKHDWNRDSKDLQKRMAEHALGVAKGKFGKIGYINFLISMTKDCDCLNKSQKPLISDIGLLASLDPVAIDAASLELVKTETGKHIAGWSYPHIDPWIQIRHGERIGLGQADFKLVEVE
jgi:uncharacterized Fe-S center protein